jgi:hypothetical protein
MSQCEVVSGLFIKRPCKNEAQHTCSVCGEPVCSVHAKSIDESVVCIKCFGQYAEQHESGLGLAGYIPFLYASHAYGASQTYYSGHHHAHFSEMDYEGFAVADNFSADDGEGYEETAFDS